MAANLHPVCVTIGESDSSGGSGIQADLKTFMALNCYGASAITAVSAQSLTGKNSQLPMPEGHVRAQLDAIAESLPIAAVKVGYLPSAQVVRVVARWLRETPKIPVVVDPIITTNKGIALGQPEVIRAICEELLPRGTVATPNRFEAAMLAGMEEVLEVSDMQRAASILLKRHGCPVLVTGGGFDGKHVDLLAALDGVSHYESPTIQRGKIVGTGCAHSGAITALLAKRDSLREAILDAKGYVTGALQAAPELPGGIGVLWHGITVREQVMAEVTAQVLSRQTPTEQVRALPPK
jgi:hydroxymethylpyrimidine kinase/phosphomethylpyrimidine kinase